MGYDSEYKIPRLITLTTDVDYRKKIILTDSLLLIGLDNYSIVAEIWQHTDKNNPSDEEDIIRVQDDFGGSVEKYTAKKEEINFAEKALTACPFPPLYARVDVFYDNSNCLALGELELIEPELWFRNHPQAATLLAEAVVNYMNTKHR